MPLASAYQFAARVAELLTVEHFSATIEQTWEVALLSELYNERVLDMASQAVAVLRVHSSQRALERLLGLSQGYLSRVLARKQVPADPLVSQLVSLAKAPEERLRELEEVWGTTPPAWLAEAFLKQQEADDPQTK